MSKWGVFETATHVHVMPCDAQKRAIGGHAVSDQCWCRPQLIDSAKKGSPKVVVHQDRERGGANA